MAEGKLMELLPRDVVRAHNGKSFVGVSTAVAIFNKDHKLFMAQRSKNTRDEHGRWDVCGGSLKVGSLIEENIRHEIKEEFAAKTKSKLHFVGVREAHRVDQFGDKTHWICVDYLIILDESEEKEIKINEVENFDDSGWFSLDKLPKPLHSAISDEYIAKLKRCLVDKA